MGMDDISFLNLEGTSLSEERVGSFVEDLKTERGSGAGVMSYADAVKNTTRQDASA